MTDTTQIATHLASTTLADTGLSQKDYFELGYWFVSLLILIATIYVIYISPIKAVEVGRQLNDEQNKDTAKRRLFLTLFSLRGNPIHYAFVNGLNQIDIVFHDNQSVLDAWHRLHDKLHQKGLVDENVIWEQHRIDLLSEMASVLEYGSLKQTDIMKHYHPQGHENREISDWEFRYDQQQYYQSAKKLNDLLIALHNNGALPIQRGIAKTDGQDQKEKGE